MYQFTQPVVPYHQVFNSRMDKNLNQQHNMLLSMMHNLQQNVIKQQMALQLCLTQRHQSNNFSLRSHPIFGKRQQEIMQMRKQAFLSNSQGSEEPSHATEEKGFTEEISMKAESNVETSTSNGNVLDQYTVEHNLEQNLEGNTDISSESDERKDPQIMRRNGFKDQIDAETSDSTFRVPRKSNKFITPKRPPSNAKHLWINFGRKIIEFGLQQTEKETQILIKRLVGKLNSKNDFKKVFEINQTDSEEEKAFKEMFGKLALFFIRFKAASAFEDSKYKQQMLAQRDFVASWIIQLTGL